MGVRVDQTSVSIVDSNCFWVERLCSKNVVVVTGVEDGFRKERQVVCVVHAIVSLMCSNLFMSMVGIIDSCKNTSLVGEGRRGSTRV